MTNEDAIEILCAYGVPQDEKKFQEALDKATKALSKQIPQYVDDKRTNAEEVGQVGYDFCPKCGALVTRNYCENCGQAVKYYRYEISEDENGTQYWKRMAQDDSMDGSKC